jgi:hypothetical protein
MLEGNLNSICNEFPLGILKVPRTTKCVNYAAQFYFKVSREPPNGI